MSLGTILLIILVLLLIGALPNWGYSRAWGRPRRASRRHSYRGLGPCAARQNLRRVVAALASAAALT